MSDFFAKIAAAQASGGGNYIKDGVYGLTVTALKEIRGHNGYSIVAEFHVDASAPNGERDASGALVEPNPVGSSVSVVSNFKHESSAGNVKALAIALLTPLGYTEAQIDAAAIATLVSDKNPARGIRVNDTTYRKSIQKGPNAGKPITLNRWEPVAQTPDEIAARRKELDESKGVAAAPTAPPPAAPSVSSAGTSLLGMLGGK